MAGIQRRRRKGRGNRRARAGERQGSQPSDRAREASEKELEQMALADPAVIAHLSGKQVKKVVVAKGRLVSLVV